MVEEERPPSWKVWLHASRPHTLTASLSPCLVGYAVAARNSHIHSLFQISFQWFLFCVLIQLATNLHNDYADFVKGADTSERLGQARATQKGWLSPTQTAAASTGCLVLAIAIGLPLLPSDMIFLCIVGSSCFNAMAYTGGPYPLGYIGLGHVSIAYWGLGEVFCFLYFGLVAVLTTPYIVLRLEGNHDAFMTLFPKLQPLCAVPAALLSTAIIVVNNLRDRQTDVKANKLTTAVRFGARFSRSLYSISCLSAFAICIIQALDSSWLHLLPLITVPFSIHCNRVIWTLEGSQLNPYVGKTALLELMHCALQSIAIIITLQF
jgi:1,4-dihydroxy-2-naphthoate polyprenyltransferase